MTNKLIFVDMPSTDPVAMQRFYEELFGWQINPRPEGEFHQIVPGDGLHLGIFNAATRPPDPAPGPLPERGGVEPRVYILVDDTPTSYLDKAIALGATKLWDELFWDDFNGYHASFRDPWGNHIVMWQPKDDRVAATGDDAPSA
jgi:predicted enzyme related to lactoylglutathione lyase